MDLLDTRDMLELLVTGGSVVDGTGAPRRPADVAVRDGRIVAVEAPGTITEPAAHHIDAGGLVVAPGFVDVHTHYDPQVLWDPLATPSSLHGVTTVIGGNCGFSIAPIDDDASAYLLPMLARVEGMSLAALEAGLDLGWDSFGSWLARLDGNLAVNAGFLVGHSTIRRVVMGDAAVGRPATDAQLDAMVELLHASLADGGLGLSTSLAAAHNDHHGDPVPSRSSTHAELLELARAVRDHDGTTLEMIPSIEPYFGEPEYELMTAMSLAADRPLNWNLLGVRPGEEDQRASKLAASDHARDQGARVVALTLPDVSRMRLNLLTGVLYDTLPEWGPVMALPFGEKVRALRHPDVRRRLAGGAAQAAYRSWADLAATTVGDTHTAANRALQGRTFGSIASERGVDPIDAVVDVALADDLRTGLYPPVTGDDDDTWKARAELWRDVRVLPGGSDAGAHLDMMMTFGCHTALLGTAVRDRGLLSLEDAVRLMTDAPARLYGLRERGRITPGFAADLVVFDPDRLAPAPVEMQHDLPGGAWRLSGGAVGIEHVVVNGREVLTAGRATGDTPGTALRSGRDTETVLASA